MFTIMEVTLVTGDEQEFKNHSLGTISVIDTCVVHNLCLRSFLPQQWLESKRSAHEKPKLGNSRSLATNTLVLLLVLVS